MPGQVRGLASKLHCTNVRFRYRNVTKSIPTFAFLSHSVLHQAVHCLPAISKAALIMSREGYVF